MIFIIILGFYLGDERTAWVLFQERAVDVLGKERALLFNGLLLDGAALALQQHGALDVLAEDRAARGLLQVGRLEEKKGHLGQVRRAQHLPRGCLYFELIELS